MLILLPMRSTALAVVTRLCQLAQKETRADSIQNKARFLEEFGAQGDDEADAEAAQGSAGTPGQAGLSAGKPPQHAALFGGNCDDHFRLGIKITRCAAWQQSCSVTRCGLASSCSLASDCGRQAFQHCCRLTSAWIRCAAISVPGAVNESLICDMYDAQSCAKSAYACLQGCREAVLRLSAVRHCSRFPNRAGYKAF